VSRFGINKDSVIITFDTYSRHFELLWVGPGEIIEQGKGRGGGNAEKAIVF
jgi:hypothetical protein